ncbi:MAG: hypothetical protein HFE30_07195 [Clostridiales bacterium]|nr:hypothetical protein [Clostridiales bacterium]
MDIDKNADERREDLFELCCEAIQMNPKNFNHIVSLLVADFVPSAEKLLLSKLSKEDIEQEIEYFQNDTACDSMLRTKEIVSYLKSVLPKAKEKSNDTDQTEQRDAS